MACGYWADVLEYLWPCLWVSDALNPCPPGTGAWPMLRLLSPSRACLGARQGASGDVEPRLRIHKGNDPPSSPNFLSRLPCQSHQIKRFTSTLAPSFLSLLLYYNPPLGLQTCNNYITTNTLWHATALLARHSTVNQHHQQHATLKLPASIHNHNACSATFSPSSLPGTSSQPASSSSASPGLRALLYRIDDTARNLQPLLPCSLSVLMAY